MHRVLWLDVCGPKKIMQLCIYGMQRPADLRCSRANKRWLEAAIKPTPSFRLDNLGGKKQVNELAKISDIED